MAGSILDWVLKKRWRVMVAAGLWVGLLMVLSYGTALLGHPTAVWFWGDMIGLLQPNI